MKFNNFRIRGNKIQRWNTCCNDYEDVAAGPPSEDCQYCGQVLENGKCVSCGGPQG